MGSAKSIIFKIRSIKQQKKEIPKDLIEILRNQGYYVKELPNSIDIINVQDTKQYFLDNNINMAKIKKLTHRG